MASREVLLDLVLAAVQLEVQGTRQLVQELLAADSAGRRGEQVVRDGTGDLAYVGDVLQDILDTRSPSAAQHVEVVQVVCLVVGA